MLEYRVLGKSGIRVSSIALGTAKFGLGPNEQDAPKLVKRAIELGINHFDCANTYGNRPSFDRIGLSPASDRRSAEEILGDALRGFRTDVILSSKVQEPVGAGPNSGGPKGGGLSRVHILNQLERSLKRLKTDYLDIYYAHHIDPTTPIEETINTFNDLIRQGKIRYYALSNFPAWEIVNTLWVADRLHLNPAVCVQMNYTLANRAIEVDFIPVCERFGLTMTIYSPLGMGLFAGPTTRQLPYVGSFLNSVSGGGGRGFKEAELRIAEQLDSLAVEWGYSPVEISLAWLLGRPAVTCAVIGAESIGELELSMKGGMLTLDGEQLAALEALGG